MPDLGRSGHRVMSLHMRADGLQYLAYQREMVDFPR